MGAWAGLFKKEWRLGLLAFLIPLLLTILCVGAGAFLAYKYDQPLMLVVATLTAITGHIFYMPWYMAYSINGEQGKMHLWLHNPQSGYRLLLAKYAAGLVTMMISIAIPYAVFFAWKDSITFLEDKHLLLFGWLSLFFIIFFSLYMAVWGVFLWLISRTLAPYLGWLRWLVMLGVVIIGVWLFGLLESTPLFDTLTRWGAIEVDFAKVAFDVEGSSFKVGIEEGEQIYLGEFLYYLVLLVMVFLFSGWLLDRKVEV